jgi:prepilin-type N-terminal cleavage/methylation domain-containing protein
MKNRNAFTMVELIVSLIIIGIIYGIFNRYTINIGQKYSAMSELKWRDGFEAALKENLVRILDTYRPLAAKIVGDGTSKWGWGNANLSHTSPFPTYEAGRILRYHLDKSALGTTKFNALAGEMEASLNGICILNKKTNTYVDFFCPKLRGMTYEYGGSEKKQFHTPGKDIDASTIPVVNVKYERERSGNGGSVKTVVTQKIDMTDVFQWRRNYSMQILQRLYSALKSFSDKKLSMEIANTQPGGLNSTDDEFVPWVWETFGDKKTDVLSALCSVDASGVCSNLDTDRIWRKTLSGKGLFMRRIVSNLFNGDNDVVVDGFNNAIYIYPLANQCSGSDYATCSVTAPKVPQDNYITIGKPPFASVLYTSLFSKKSKAPAAYGRVFVGY